MKQTKTQVFEAVKVNPAVFLDEYGDILTNDDAEEAAEALTAYLTSPDFFEDFAAMFALDVAERNGRYEEATK